MNNVYRNSTLETQFFQKVGCTIKWIVENLQYPLLTLNFFAGGNSISRGPTVLNKARRCCYQRFSFLGMLLYRGGVSRNIKVALIWISESRSGFLLWDNLHWFTWESVNLISRLTEIISGCFNPVNIFCYQKKKLFTGWSNGWWSCFTREYRHSWTGEHKNHHPLLHPVNNFFFW